MLENSIIESYGDYEYRIHNSLGPECNPETYNSEAIPAYIVETMPGRGAEKAGILEFDHITKINEIPINNNSEFFCR